MARTPWQSSPRACPRACATANSRSRWRSSSTFHRATHSVLILRSALARVSKDGRGRLWLDSMPAAPPMGFVAWSLNMTITITAFERPPDGGKGLARDTRVRWALEEVGQPYEVRLVSFRAMKEPAHLALHPFGPIPTYEEGDLALFETGAIVFHIAERHAGLLPDDANARARAITWMFAALSTVEPPILELANAKLLERDKPWAKDRLPVVADRVRDRLKQLSARLGDAEWLDGAFSAGDLMMVHVLQRLKPSGMLDEYSNLSAYVARAKRGPPTSGLSTLNWRSTPASRRPAD